MALNESDYKSAFVKQARELGWYARRIEDKFQVGVPDLWVKPTGLPMFVIEAKIIGGHSYAPRARQYVDLLQLHDPRNTYACVLGIQPKDDDHPFVQLYFATPREKIDLRPPNNITISRGFCPGLIMFYEEVNNARRA